MNLIVYALIATTTLQLSKCQPFKLEGEGLGELARIKVSAETSHLAHQNLSNTIVTMMLRRISMTMRRTAAMMRMRVIKTWVVL